MIARALLALGVFTAFGWVALVVWCAFAVAAHRRRSPRLAAAARRAAMRHDHPAGGGSL